MTVALILCILLAVGSLGFAAYIWSKRKSLDQETAVKNAWLMQEQAELIKRNESLQFSNEQKLQESTDLCELLKIKRLEET